MLTLTLNLCLSLLAAQEPVDYGKFKLLIAAEAPQRLPIVKAGWTSNDRVFCANAGGITFFDRKTLRPEPDRVRAKLASYCPSTDVAIILFDLADSFSLASKSLRGVISLKGSELNAKFPEGTNGESADWMLKSEDPEFKYSWRSSTDGSVLALQVMREKGAGPYPPRIFAPWEKKELLILEDFPTALALSPDRKRLSMIVNRKLQVYDVASRKKVKDAPMEGTTLKYSHDGKTMAIASGPKVYLFSSDKWGKEETLSGHGGTVQSVDWSPNSAHLITASLDHTAVIWRAQGGKVISILKGTNDEFGGAAFSPDGTRALTLGTASGNAGIKIWGIQD